MGAIYLALLSGLDRALVKPAAKLKSEREG
jgi:hypothetical protein